MLKYRIIPVTPFEQNCSLIWCDETMQGAVVDPGGDLDRIDAAVQQAAAVPQSLLAEWHPIDDATSPMHFQLR